MNVSAVSIVVDSDDEEAGDGDQIAKKLHDENV
jgi:hypothetical protein